MDSSNSIERITQFPALPVRPRDAHKGTFGKVTIVAGSRGMSGAACLAGVAALRGGAGLVTVASPAGVNPIVAGYEPSYLTCPLEEDHEGRVSLEAMPRVMDAFAGQTAGAIGPGLGSSADVEELVHLLYRTCELPLVIDADGLNALAARKNGIVHSASAGPRILTPHPGEFSRLTGLSIAEIEARRLELAVSFAAAHHVVLLLKGAGTVITDGRRAAINSTGNSGMATGGAGDVLTGAYWHGLAGDLAAEDLSEPSLIASDLLRYLPLAWRQLPTPGMGKLGFQ
ncbi:MAG: NAD(P)H-hydrate dehydratase [Planctomycetales bacterium 12-60-4]|nr:MAG: NAD(P)H-hydrate dehydratase [Planctomycetales bacterium 12-60-4]